MLCSKCLGGMRKAHSNMSPQSLEHFENHYIVSRPIEETWLLAHAFPYVHLCSRARASLRRTIPIYTRLSTNVGNKGKHILWDNQTFSSLYGKDEDMYL